MAPLPPPHHHHPPTHGCKILNSNRREKIVQPACFLASTFPNRSTRLDSLFFHPLSIIHYLLQAWLSLIIPNFNTSQITNPQHLPDFTRPSLRNFTQGFDIRAISSLRIKPSTSTHSLGKRVYYPPRTIMGEFTFFALILFMCLCFIIAELPTKPYSLKEEPTLVLILELCRRFNNAAGRFWKLVLWNLADLATDSPLFFWWQSPVLPILPRTLSACLPSLPLSASTLLPLPRCQQ